MADNRERLIDRDLEESEEAPTPSLLSSPALWLAVKISVGLGVLSGVVVAFVLIFMEISTTQEQLMLIDEKITDFEQRQNVVSEGIKQLNKVTQALNRDVKALDVSAAQGDLREALGLLHTLTENLDKQLAVNRNGLISLSRMIKGSRVWQDDYRAQFQELFQYNRQTKDDIQKLRGLADPTKEDSHQIDLDF